MQVEHLSYQGSVPLSCGSGLNVVATQDEYTGTLLGDLVGHVIYGARLRVSGQPVDQPAGFVDVSSRHGKYRLERHTSHADRGTFTEPRLTVAPLDGSKAHPDTARQLLEGMSAEIAARLFVLNSTNSQQLDWLLSEQLASELCRLDRDYAPTGKDPRHARRDVSYHLLSERDDLAAQVESVLSEKRIASGALESSLRELDLDAQAAERTLEENSRELERVSAELAELETQLRYNELAEFVSRETDEAHHADQQPELADLDEEIARWRRTLADLEAREAHVRRELSQLHPDEASPLLPLADQRASIAIAQRLVADLNSEVARFARAGGATANDTARDSHTCLCRQSHARLHPMIDTLGQQIDKLGALIAQYEAAVRIEQMNSEARHLLRSQTELRATIDHLLDRRQSRLRTSRTRSIESAENVLPSDWRAAHASLERRRSELESQVREGKQRLGQLRSRREQLLEDRAALLRDSSLTSQRQKLDEVTRKIELGLQVTTPRQRKATRWRASDILAQLTDGRLRELRLMQGGRRATVVDRHGNVEQQQELSALDRRLVAISLQLAAVAGAAEWGADLPLIVVDPFRDLPDTEAAILALVLLDFARSGHQVTAFTSSYVVVDRWKAAGQPIQQLSMGAGEVSTAAPRLATSTLTVEERVEHRSASSKSPAPAGDGFALRLDDSIDRFEVFGDDTGPTFREIGIGTIGDLLEADYEDVSRRLDRTGISAGVVELWQTHVAFLVYVPELTLEDAQLLTGAHVGSIEQLANYDADELATVILEYLDSPRGVRHRRLGSRDMRSYGRRWIEGARRNRDRWSQSGYARRWRSRSGSSRSNRSSTKRSTRSQAQRSRSGRTTKPASVRKQGKAKRTLRFRLSRTSAVVDAPSIGPKTAKRLAKAGITTVADLLAAGAAETAEALDVKHISAETIVAWQHQAQLMCRVPELLARDTQILVGSGFTTPEDIAAAEAADLLEFAKSYAATPEGNRALRGSDPPDLSRVTKWIDWAGHRRAMEAA